MDKLVYDYRCFRDSSDVDVEVTDLDGPEWITKTVEDDLMRTIASYLEFVNMPGQEGWKMIRWL